METKNLYEALVCAQQVAKAVEKDAKNAHHGYKYASSEGVIAESRSALAEVGLAFFPTHYEILFGGEATEDSLSAKYRLVHLSGEVLEVSSVTPIVPDKGRPADKAIAAAKTYDLSYMLRGLLLLPRVEEGTAVDGRDDRKHTPQRDRKAELLAELAELTASGKLSVDEMRAINKEVTGGKGSAEMSAKELGIALDAMKRRVAWKIKQSKEAPTRPNPQRPSTESVPPEKTGFISPSAFWEALRKAGLTEEEVRNEVGDMYGRTPGDLESHQRAEYLEAVLARREEA